MRPDLLAIAAQDMENRLRQMPSFPGGPSTRSMISAEIKSCGLLGGGSGWQALDIGKHYGVFQEECRACQSNCLVLNELHPS